MAPSVTTLERSGINRSISYDKWKLVGEKHGSNVAATNVKGIRKVASKAAINDVLQSQIAQVDPNSCKPGDENAFYVADLGEIYRQHMRWKMKLGRVRPFYG